MCIHHMQCKPRCTLRQPNSTAFAVWFSLARSRSRSRSLCECHCIRFHSIIIELFCIVRYELYIHLLFNQIKMIRIKMPNRSHCKINCRMLRATENVQIFQSSFFFGIFLLRKKWKHERFRCLRAKEERLSQPATNRMDNTHRKFSYHLFSAVSPRICFSFSFIYSFFCLFVGE